MRLMTCATLLPTPGSITFIAELAATVPVLATLHVPAGAVKVVTAVGVIVTGFWLLKQPEGLPPVTLTMLTLKEGCPYCASIGDPEVVPVIVVPSLLIESNWICGNLPS